MTSNGKYGRTLGVMLHHGAYRDADGRTYIKDVWGGFLRQLAPRLGAQLWLYAPVTTDGAGRFQHFEVRADDGLEVRTQEGAGGSDALKMLRADLPRVDALLLFLPTLRSLAAAQVARAAGKPFVVYSGLGGSTWDPAGMAAREVVYSRLERAALGHARGAITAGVEIEAHFSRFLPTFRTAPITGVVSTPELRPKEREVLYVGSLSQRKGVPELIAAWRAGAPAGWRLVVAGTGDLEPEVRRLAGERDDVDVLGYVEHGPALFERYARAAVFVLPSHNEGFPRVLLEAGAHGCALAATKVGGVPAAFEDGDYEPRWFEPGDADGLARALSALTDGDAWQADADRARTWFEDSFGDRDRALEAAAFVTTVIPELV